MQAALDAAMPHPDSADDPPSGATLSQRAARVASAGVARSRAAARQRAAPGVAAQVRVLAWRACLNVARHPTLLRVQLLTFIGMGVGVGLVWGGPLGAECNDDDDDGDGPSNAADFQTAAGLFSFILLFFAFAGLSMLSAVAEDWRLFWREYHAGLYRAEVHVTVKLALDLLLVRVLPALVFGAVVYLLAGLRREAPAFLLFELIVALANLNAGLLCSAIGLALHRSPGAATLLAVVVMLLTVIWGSLQVSTDCLHAVLRWVPFCSWAFYAYDLMLTEELRGEIVKVTVPGVDTVVYLEAESLLDLLSFGKLSAWVNILALCGLAFFWLLVNCAIVLLKLRPPRCALPCAGSGGGAGAGGGAGSGGDGRGVRNVEVARRPDGSTGADRTSNSTPGAFRL